MADAIANLILAVMQAIFEALVSYTGAELLGLFGRKSNSSVEAIVGLLFWAAVAVVW